MKAKTSALDTAMQASELEFSRGSWAEPTAQRILEAQLVHAVSPAETLMAHLQLARQYRLQHHLAKSKQHLAKAKLALDQMQPSAAQLAAWHLESGTLAMATESFTKARRDLQLAHKFDPQNEAVRCELYDFESCEGSFSAAAKLSQSFEDSSSYRALNLTAWKFLGIENDELAEQYFQKAIEQARTQYGEDHAYVGHALLMLALCREEQRKRSEVPALYAKAAAILHRHVTADHPWREMIDEMGKRVRKYSAPKPKSPTRSDYQDWRRALERLRDVGGVEVSIGKPATEAQVRIVEKRLQHKLPASFRDVLLHFASQFETLGDQPGIGWDVTELIENQKVYLDYVDALPPGEDRTLWRNRLCVVNAGGGDAAVVDLSSADGAVYFFACHGEPQVHGRRLASSFRDFVDRAIAIDCLTSANFHRPYEEFLGEDGLDARSAAAIACRKRLGLSN